MRLSVVASTLEVASSRIRMRGSASSAGRSPRAGADRPRACGRSPTMSRPSGRSSSTSDSPAPLGGGHDPRLARVGARVGDVVAQRSRTGRRRRRRRPPRGAATRGPPSARPRRPRAPCPSPRRRAAARASRASSCPSPWVPRAPPCGRAPPTAPRPGARARRPRNRRLTPRSATRPPPRRGQGVAGGGQPRLAVEDLEHRAPLATARWAMPSAMPSIRIGEVSIST